MSNGGNGGNGNLSSGAIICICMAIAIIGPIVGNMIAPQIVVKPHDEKPDVEPIKPAPSPPYDSREDTNLGRSAAYSGIEASANPFHDDKRSEAWLRGYLVEFDRQGRGRGLGTPAGSPSFGTPATPKK